MMNKEAVVFSSGMEGEGSKLEVKKLIPGKLVPPPPAIQRMLYNDKRKMPRNPVLKFFKIFFGEGF